MKENNHQLQTQVGEGEVSCTVVPTYVLSMYVYMCMSFDSFVVAGIRTQVTPIKGILNCLVIEHSLCKGNVHCTAGLQYDQITTYFLFGRIQYSETGDQETSDTSLFLG